VHAQLQAIFSRVCSCFVISCFVYCRSRARLLPRATVAVQSHSRIDSFSRLQTAGQTAGGLQQMKLGPAVISTPFHPALPFFARPAQSYSKTLVLVSLISTPPSRGGRSALCYICYSCRSMHCVYVAICSVQTISIRYTAHAMTRVCVYTHTAVCVHTPLYRGTGCVYSCTVYTPWAVCVAV
jgi:hypothetical protein